MVKDEGMDWNGLSKRLGVKELLMIGSNELFLDVYLNMGNLLPPMTLPLFAANIMNNLTYWHFLETISMIPLVSNHFFMVMMFIFKFHGVEAFTKVKKFGDIISLVRRGLDHHFSL